jgi:hypothetical protein
MLNFYQKRPVFALKIYPRPHIGQWRPTKASKVQNFQKFGYYQCSMNNHQWIWVTAYFRCQNFNFWINIKQCNVWLWVVLTFLSWTYIFEFEVSVWLQKKLFFNNVFQKMSWRQNSSRVTESPNDPNVRLRDIPRIVPFVCLLFIFSEIIWETFKTF